jgi:hypothetical protein
MLELSDIIYNIYILAHEFKLQNILFIHTFILSLLHAYIQ